MTLSSYVVLCEFQNEQVLNQQVKTSVIVRVWRVQSGWAFVSVDLQVGYKSTGNWKADIGEWNQMPLFSPIHPLRIVTFKHI